MSEQQPIASGRGRGGGKNRRNGSKGGRGGRGGGSKGNQKATNDENGSSKLQNLNVADTQSKGGRDGSGKANSHRRKRQTPMKETPLSEVEKKRLEEEIRQIEQKATDEIHRKRVDEEQKVEDAINAVKQRERQVLLNKFQDTISSLETVVVTTMLHKTNRESLAAESLMKARKDFEMTKKTLTSDLKKCTAFVKKVKVGTAWSMKTNDIAKDIASLNLSRYVEEVTAAILETRLKVGDIPVVVALCVAMHMRYADFLSNLLPSLWSLINSKLTDDNAKSRRIYVRLVTEFLLNGIIHDTKHLIKLIGEITGGLVGTFAISDANLVVSFCNAAGFEILGGTPRSIREHMMTLTTELNNFKAGEESEIPMIITEELANKINALLVTVGEVLLVRAVPPEITHIFCNHCTGAYQILSKSLVVMHAKLQKLENRCDQDRLLQGSLTDVREKGLAEARILVESLHKNVETLSDILDQSVPTLVKENEEEFDVGQGIALWTKGDGGEDGGGDNDFGSFDDEETRSFYCDISDLLATIPPALLGMTSEEIERIKAANLIKYGDEGLQFVDDSVADVEPPSEDQFLQAESAVEQVDTEQIKGDEDREKDKDNPHYRLMVLLEQELPECCRREQIDDISEKFCVNHGSSKTSRKRLVKTLFQVPRSRLDLLPYYARMMAILGRVYSDIASPVVIELEQQFHGQAKFKKNHNLEGRLKTARYIGELTKFRVAPPIVSLRCFRRCLDDFNGGNIDVACCILESCGRYLYRTKHTVSRISQLMDAMLRIAKSKTLDERAHSLIQSAMFMVKPPPSVPRKQPKIYPPLESYLRYLMLVKLDPDESSIAFVTKHLLRFPWNDPSKQCGALICKYMLKACRKGRYTVISAVAGVAASIRRSKPEVAARLVDACLEEIQWAMENPNFRDQQRTIAYSRLLGELHVASLVSGLVVIQQLYKYLNFGHEIPMALRLASEKISGEPKGHPYLPVLFSTGRISQTIGEDEVMDELLFETIQEKETVNVIAISKYSKFDPRVPSILDPPSSVFRIKMACTLLGAAAKTLVTRSNLSALEGFFASFQRYLFTKTLLPADVEFALLDTFDAVDSLWKKSTKERKKIEDDENTISESMGFLRFNTWLGAHNATIRQEEEDALVEQKVRVRLEALAAGGDATENELLADAQLEMEDYDFDAMSQSVDDEVDSDTESEEGKEVIEQGNDLKIIEGDLENDEFDLDDENLYDDTESMDEDTYMKQLEDEEFERELRRVTMDALEKGKNSAQSRGKVADTMITGSQFFRKKERTEEIKAATVGGVEGVIFQLLKKGNKGKVEAKQLIVPKETNLAKQAERKDDEAARERDMLKARVLQYEAESAEHGEGGGNVYLEQTKLQFIRNRPLTMQEIDQNFGTNRGDRDGSVISGSRRAGGSERNRTGQSLQGRGDLSRQGGMSAGRGRGRSGGGRTLRTY